MPKVTHKQVPAESPTQFLPEIIKQNTHKFNLTPEFNLKFNKDTHPLNFELKKTKQKKEVRPLPGRNPEMCLQKVALLQGGQGGMEEGWRRDGGGMEEGGEVGVDCSLLGFP